MSMNENQEDQSKKPRKVLFLSPLAIAQRGYLNKNNITRNLQRAEQNEHLQQQLSTYIKFLWNNPAIGGFWSQAIQPGSATHCRKSQNWLHKCVCYFITKRNYGSAILRPKLISHLQVLLKLHPRLLKGVWGSMCMCVCEHVDRGEFKQFFFWTTQML